MTISLRALLDLMEAQGELRRITSPVSPHLIITEVAHRHARRPAARASETASSFDPGHANLGGHALLFENVEGCDFPLAINIFGSYRRIERALGCAENGGLEAIASRLAAIVQPHPPRSLREIIETAKRFLPLLRSTPRRVRRVPCQDVVRLTERGEVDLRRLPLIRCWPLDGDPSAVGCGLSPEEAGTSAGGGRYITFAGMHTIHHDDAGDSKPRSHNIGMYRAQLVDATRLAMHWHLHHDGAAHWRSWKRAGKPMPIAICFGGEACLPYAATAPLPPGISELLMAGFLAGRGIELAPAVTVPLRVPAQSEIVIEGFVRTDAGEVDWHPGSGEALGPGAVYEGPFADHTGYYSLPDRYPVVEVTAVTHRNGAVFPATIVGLPPQEDYYLGKATERLFLPLLRTLVPDIVDYHLPMFGAFHNAAFIQIRKAYALQARRVMHAIWGAGQMAWTKMIFVVDDDVNVHDEKAVLGAVARQWHAVRDVEFVRGPLDILDHAAPHLGAGGKIGFDATSRMSGEAAEGIGEDVLIPRPGARAVQNRLDELCASSERCRAAVALDAGEGRIVVLAVRKRAALDARKAMEELWRALPLGADLLIALDEDAPLHSWEESLFRFCAGMDPLRDRAYPEDGSSRLGFDATTKIVPQESWEGQPVRPYPPILEMDEQTVREVDARRAEFGLH